MDTTLSALPAGLAGRAHRATDLLHTLVYFVPEAEQEYVAAGLRPGRMGYFASRSAAMGAVGPGVASATFFAFNPDLISRYLPRAWSLADPEHVLAARLHVADRALRRLLGDHVLSSAELAELAGLARSATQPLRHEARAMFAAHARLPWPQQPHLQLWHAATLLREYRGDGHAAVVVRSGLSGIEALVTETATGRGFNESAAKQVHGWDEGAWQAASEALRERGYLDAHGLTSEGVALRERIERETDELDTAAWLHLGEDGTGRLIELGKSLTRTVIGNGAFPATLFGTAG